MFLDQETRKCTIYHGRPLVCREFPTTSRCSYYDLIQFEEGVLHLKDSEDKTCFVAVDKVVVVWEAKDDEHRAGFVSFHPGEK